MSPVTKITLNYDNWRFFPWTEEFADITPSVSEDGTFGATDTRTTVLKQRSVACRRETPGGFQRQCAKAAVEQQVFPKHSAE